MLKVVEKSKAIKTTDCAVTYRSGNDDVFGTCPKHCALNPNSTMSTSSNASLSCPGCLNLNCCSEKYEISKEAMKEIAAFGTFLEQFHQKQQQIATKTSQDTNHQLTKNVSPEKVSDE